MRGGAEEHAPDSGRFPHSRRDLLRQGQVGPEQRLRIGAPALSRQVDDRFAAGQLFRQETAAEIVADDPHRAESGLTVDPQHQRTADETARAGDCYAAHHFFSGSFFSRTGMNSMKSTSARLFEPEYWLLAPTLMMKYEFGILPYALR